MRTIQPSSALIAALLLAGSVGAAPAVKRTTKPKQPAPVAAPVSVTTQELLDRLARAELLAGLTEVTGPGLVVTLRHCPRVIKGADPASLRIQDQDLNAVLSALRAAGAEALAVEGSKSGARERILVTSAARNTEEGVLLNGTHLVPPYRVLAVGSAEAMRAELLREGGVVKKAGLDQLQMVEMEPAAELTLPAYNRAQSPKFARVPETVIAAAPGSDVAQTQPIPANGAGPEMPEPVKMPEETLPPMGTKPVVSQPAAGPPKVASVVRRPKNGTATTPQHEPETPAKPDPPTGAEVTPPKSEPGTGKVEAPGKSPMAGVKKPVVVPKPSPTVPAAPETVAYFGGKGLAKYHAAGCRFGERIEKGDRVPFTSTEAAKQAGRVPCSICLGEK